MTVKLNSQVKISKIVEMNEDNSYGGDNVVRSIMDVCKEQLLKLSSEKDKEVEAYLEEFAEEKVVATMQIKQKYSKMLTLLKVSAAKPGNQAAAAEKIAALEEKKRGEEAEILAELSDKRTEAL